MSITMVPTTVTAAVTATSDRQRLPMVPWRDPHTVSPEELSQYIQVLEKACLDNPQSAELRTSLGMAYAMNYEVYKAMDSLETATRADPEYFWAQFKYAELHYRLRALPRAEEETVEALHLARNPWELAVARKQLFEIRKLRREGTRDIAWTKSLLKPGLLFTLMLIVLFAAMVWK